MADKRLQDVVHILAAQLIPGTPKPPCARDLMSYNILLYPPALDCFCRQPLLLLQGLLSGLSQAILFACLLFLPPHAYTCLPSASSSLRSSSFSLAGDLYPASHDFPGMENQGSYYTSITKHTAQQSSLDFSPPSCSLVS